MLGTNEAPNSAAGGSDTLTVNPPPACPDFDQLDDFFGLPNLGQTPFGNWSSVVNTPDGLNAWCSNSGATASAGTGPAIGNPDPYVYLESSASGQSPPCGQSITLGSVNYLESNVLDASTYGFAFDFDWNMNGTAMDTSPASLPKNSSASKPNASVRPRSREKALKKLITSAGVRGISAPVRRFVCERDGDQCTFESPDGKRCPERDRLEFH